MFPEMTDEQIAAWLDSWREYRDDNTDVPTEAPTHDMPFYTFYITILGYASLEPDELAITSLDEAIDYMSREELDALEIYLNSFHDYMVIMGIVDV